MTDARMFILGEDTIPEIAKLVGSPEDSWHKLLLLDDAFGLKTRIVVVNRPQIDSDTLEEILHMPISDWQWKRFNQWQDGPVDHPQLEAIDENGQGTDATVAEEPSSS